MRCKSVLLSAVLGLLVIPLISAFNGYYSNPLDYLNNEWTKFAIIVVLLFVAIYGFVNNRMHNPPVAGVVAAGLSLLISIPIMKRNLLEPFLEPGIVDWIVIIAIGIAFLFLFYKFGTRKKPDGSRGFSVWRLIIFLFLLLIMIYLLADLLPNTFLYGTFGDVIDWIKGLSWWIIIIAVIVIIGLPILNWWREKRRYQREGFMKKRGEKKAEKKWKDKWG